MKPNSTYLPTYLEYHGCEKQLFSYEEATARWRSAAWLRLPVRKWQIGDPGWVAMNDQIRACITLQELTEADEAAIVEDLGHIALARADALLEGFDTLTVTRDRGIDGETPTLLIDEFAVTPEPFKSMRYLGIRWYVQSVEIDDREDEFTDLNKAIACAASRALARRIQDRAEREGYSGFSFSTLTPEADFSEFV